MDILMDDPTSQHTKALKALRAERLGFFLMGLIVGGCMIGVAVWGYWTFDRPDTLWPHKHWVLLAALGCMFAWVGISIWKGKSLEIRDREQAMIGDLNHDERMQK